jgi:hypothetical protein
VGFYFFSDLNLLGFTVFISCFICLLSLFFFFHPFPLVLTLNNLENYKTAERYENHLILKKAMVRVFCTYTRSFRKVLLYVLYTHSFSHKANKSKSRT